MTALLQPTVRGRRLPNGHELLPLDQYRKVVVSFSGGKDSLACVLHLLDLGVSRDRIELWHQCVDGEPGTPTFMDWPCTEGYTRAAATALGLTLRLQWKHGGFLGEMLREDRLTAPSSFERSDGEVVTVGGTRGKLATRRRFPQVSADLSVRWCSAYLKIDVAAKAVSNDPAFDVGPTLFVTGERRDESAARSQYHQSEPHRTHNRTRHVDHWRPIIDWDESMVWDIIRRYGIRPHPAYELGWGRVSCMACIFGDPDQWASLRDLDPVTFALIAHHERDFDVTIHRGRSVADLADKGTSFLADAPFELRRLALAHHYPFDLIRVQAGEWRMPKGAFRHGGGPT